MQGKDAISFLEGLVVGDIQGLADGTGSLSVFTNEKGGIIDDTVVTKVGTGAPCLDYGQEMACAAEIKASRSSCVAAAVEVSWSLLETARRYRGRHYLSMCWPRFCSHAVSPCMTMPMLALISTGERR